MSDKMLQWKASRKGGKSFVTDFSSFDGGSEMEVRVLGSDSKALPVISVGGPEIQRL